MNTNIVLRLNQALQAILDENDLQAAEALMKWTSDAQVSYLFIHQLEGVKDIVEKKLLPSLPLVLQQPLSPLHIQILELVVQNGKHYPSLLREDGSQLMGFFVAIILGPVQQESTIAVALDGIQMIFSHHQEPNNFQLNDQFLQMLLQVQFIPKLFDFCFNNEVLRRKSLECLSVLAFGQEVQKLMLEAQFVQWLETITTFRLEGDDNDTRSVNAVDISFLTLVFKCLDALATSTPTSHMKQTLLDLLKSGFSDWVQRLMQHYSALTSWCLSFYLHVLNYTIDEDRTRILQLMDNSAIDWIKQLIVVSTTDEQIHLYLEIVASCGSSELATVLMDKQFGRLLVKVYVSQGNRSTDIDGIIPKLTEQALRNLSKILLKPYVANKIAGDTTVEEIACFLALSNASKIRSEGLWMLHLLYESPIPLVRQRLISSKHLLGALHISAVKTETQDPQLKQLVPHMIETLAPQVRMLEQQNGSLIGQTELELAFPSLESALTCAESIKAKGNDLFHCGDYHAAAIMYRHSLATVRVAESARERELNGTNGDVPNVENLMANLSIGSSVKAQHPTVGWTEAIVADVKSSRDTRTGELVAAVDLIFDVDGEEQDDVVATSIRLRCSREEQRLIDELLSACLLNLAKCQHKLNNIQDAQACLEDVLRLGSAKWQVFYLRGLLFLSDRNLRLAKENLFRANQLKPGHAPITNAWKHLQALVKRRNAVDKRIRREMLEYVASVTGTDLA